jgi:D-sedoheptulose 7-phosphate isomerase
VIEVSQAAKTGSQTTGPAFRAGALQAPLSFPSEIDAFILALEAMKTRFADGRLEKAVDLLKSAALADLPIMICGNGGSAADAQHIAAELVGRFKNVGRRAINAISLASDSSVLTAWANDVGYNEVFARQVEAYAGRRGAVLLAISTSGRSANVIRAAHVARTMHVPVIGLTGDGGGILAVHCNVLLDVPSSQTAIVQQLHEVVFHHLCGRLEEFISKART